MTPLWYETDLALAPKTRPTHSDSGAGVTYNRSSGRAARFLAADPARSPPGAEGVH
jgi:hypothetical protein